VERTKLDELVEAYEFVSLGGGFEEIYAYIHKTDGTVVVDDENVSGEPCSVENVGEDPSYLPIPDKYELDLGQRLVHKFIATELPDCSDKVYQIFRKRGAYSRYKDLLEREGALDKWYEYEAESTKQALREWCQANAIPIDDDISSELSDSL